jgi:hypothetical protein
MVLWEDLSEIKESLCVVYALSAALNSVLLSSYLIISLNLNSVPGTSIEIGMVFYDTQPLFSETVLCLCVIRV